MMTRLARLRAALKRAIDGPGGEPDFRSRIVRNASIGIAGTALVMAASVARTIFLARTIPVADYGRILIVINLVAVLRVLLDVRLNDVLYRFVPAFRADRDPNALRGLLLTSLATALVTGAIIGAGLFVASGWLESGIYRDPGLGQMLQIYAPAAVFLAFEGVYTALLRLRNRFGSVVLPEIIASFTTLGGVVALRFLAPDHYGPAAIIAIFLVGGIVQSLPPLVIALREWRSSLSPRELSIALRSLGRHRRSLRANLVQTNLAAYLKLGADTGGIFLLGVLATPAQVGIYGLARQLLTPITALQNNIQAAIAPEIVTLYAHRQLRRLADLVARVTKWIAAVGAAGLLLAYPLVGPVVGLVARPDYAHAVRVVYVLLPAGYVMFLSLAYYPLAVAMDRLGRRNLIVAIRFIYLGVAVASGLDAIRLALVQLTGALTTRVLNDTVLMRKLRTEAK